MDDDGSVVMSSDVIHLLLIERHSVSDDLKGDGWAGWQFLSC